MDKLLSPRDVGRRFNVTTATVQAWDRAGTLKALRDSAGRRLFREADVRRFAAQREKARAEREVTGQQVKMP